MQYTIIHTPPAKKCWKSFFSHHFLAISKAFPRLRPWASLGVPGRPYVPVSLRKVRAEEGRRDMTPPPIKKYYKYKSTRGTIPYSNYQTYLLIVIEDAKDIQMKRVHSQDWPSSVTQQK